MRSKAGSRPGSRSRSAAADARGASEPEIVISEEGGVRYLHFGTPWVQGAMRIARPDQLVLAYQRDMMAWLMLLEPPAEIAQLGLGAGALARFCRRRLPQSHVTVVERSRLVIETARSLYALPASDPGLRLVHEDAAGFLARSAVSGRYGVLQVDLYDAEARGPVLDSEDFYRACREALAEPGVLVVNLFGERRVLRPNLARLGRVFGKRVLRLAPTAEGNVVVLALKGPVLAVPRQALERRAAQLARRYRLPAPDWARALASQMGATGADSLRI